MRFKVFGTPGIFRQCIVFRFHFFLIEFKGKISVDFVLQSSQSNGSKSDRGRGKAVEAGNVQCFEKEFSFNFSTVIKKYISTFSWFPMRHIVATVKLSIQLFSKPSGNKTKSGIIDMWSIFMFTDEYFQKYTYEINKQISKGNTILRKKYFFHKIM